MYGLLRRLGIWAENSDRFGVAGKVALKRVSREGVGVVFLAWRCLYAEVVRGRIEDKRLRLSAAYARLVSMIIGRVRAYGYKWRRWYNRIRWIQPKKRKEIPKKYRKLKLIETERDGTYRIREILLDEYEHVKGNR